MRENRLIIAAVIALTFFSVYLLLNAYQQIDGIFSKTTDTIKKQQSQRDLLSTMYGASQERTITLLNMLGEKDHFELDDLNQNLSRLALKFTDARAEFIKVGHEHKINAMLKALSKASRANEIIQTQIAELTINNKHNKAKHLMFSQALPQQKEVLEYIILLIEEDEKNTNESINELTFGIENSSNKFILLGFLMAGSSLIIIIIVLTRSSKKEHALLAKTLKANKHSERLLKRLSDQQFAIDQHSIVATTDTKGTITYVNQKFCDISGYTEHELLGENHRILNSGHQNKAYWKEMFHTIANGNVWHDEVKNITKQGHFYWVDTTIIPVKWDTSLVIKNEPKATSSKTLEKNTIKGYIAIRTDITATKEQEEKLINAKIAAEAAAIAKTQFLATMSHEIRTPMNGVIGMAQLLEETSLDNEQREYLNTIICSGNSLLSIINDILDFSKLDADMAELENIEYNLEKTCLECLELIAPKANTKKLNLFLDYAPTCPRYFMGDPSRLRQILLNLLGNAIKFTRTGYIRLAVSYHQNRLRIEVQDTGIGLKAEAIDSLFDEFTQADNSTTRQYGGTGLGLAITKKLITLMNAKIGIQSRYKEGSTFWIEGAFETSRQALKPQRPSLSNLKILFINTCEQSRRIYKNNTTYLGAQAAFEPSLSNVINILNNAAKEKHPFNIIFINPDETSSALELGQEIRQHSELKNLKLVIFSRFGVKVDDTLIERMGFDAYINKISAMRTFEALLTRLSMPNKESTFITPYQLIESENRKKPIQVSFKAHILLAEDILPNQLIASKFLTQMGVNIDIANNGEEAVNAVKDSSYDLIFMDCRMPIKDGYQATKEIRNLRDSTKNNIPIIALTANASVDDRKLCTQAGMNEVITKPYKKEQLAICLEQWLPNRNTIEANNLSQENIENSHAYQSLNQNTFESLKNDMGEDLEHILTAGFESIRTNINNLCHSNEKTPTDELIRWAHSIKSPAAFLGAETLSEHAKALEEALKNNTRININNAGIELLNEFEKVQNHVKTELRVNDLMLS